MSLLYKNEHLSCIHYRKEDPLIVISCLKEGMTFEKEMHNTSLLLFLKKGRMTVSYNAFVNKELNEQEVLLLPPNCQLSACVLDEASFILFRFDLQMQLCESFSMTQLHPYSEGKRDGFCVLPFKKQLSIYLTLLEGYVQDGINCIHFYDLKKQELFYLLRGYYTKELLADFFYPILDKEDMRFKKLILDNCLSAKNVQELASLANYSTSGFIKKFARCFDNSPHRWISQYKADRILHDINQGDKSFKEISIGYNFSSMPHFIDFCKKQYGQTPGKLRKKTENTIL